MVNLTEDKNVRKASFHGFVLSEKIRKSRDPFSEVRSLSDHDLVDLACHYSIEEMTESGNTLSRYYHEDAILNYFFASAMVKTDSAFSNIIENQRDTLRNYCTKHAEFQRQMSECDLAVYRLRATGRAGRELEDIVRMQPPEMHSQMNAAMVYAAQLAMVSE